MGGFAESSVGWLEGYMQINLHTRTSYLRLRDDDSGLTCSGFAQRTPTPPNAARRCQGSQGHVRLQCSDGRTINARYRHAGSCGRGVGEGEDQFGQRFVFAFGEDEGALRGLVGRPSGGPPADGR